ncbi:hypothetical protein SAMN04488134_11291 [Amphibacillus marinus]|uniref:Uncharacterized protein n=1 Tax=Amphibacillus marinus TaxID=872970 RepID=A0A1H8SE51_9BACI|nr:hypothetical protein [Amphibacillus marinus]SEO76473.1 hypothetical protein SAMN04488134_11291 [Amphibacillus marinus]
MGTFKKLFVVVLLFTLLIFNYSPIVSAQGSNIDTFQYIEPPHSPSETTVINTEIFFPEVEEGLIRPFAVNPGNGATKISDELTKLNGLRDRRTRDFKSMETFKSASITIATKIPVVGSWIQTGNSIWNSLKKVKKDIGSGTGKSVTVSTQYSDRYFYHWLYVYNGGRWQDYGYSLSRYWYEHVVVSYIPKGSDKVKVADYDYSKLKDKPSVISKAPNYMNKKRLAEIIQGRWRNGTGKYSESY